MSVSHVGRRVSLAREAKGRIPHFSGVQGVVVSEGKGDREKDSFVGDEGVGRGGDESGYPGKRLAFAGVAES